MTLENKARNQEFCPVCKERKTLNAIVCWYCFKYSNSMSGAAILIENWLKKYSKNWEEVKQ